MDTKEMIIDEQLARVEIRDEFVTHTVFIITSLDGSISFEAFMEYPYDSSEEKTLRQAALTKKPIVFSYWLNK